MPSLIKKKGSRIPLEQRHLAYGNWSLAARSRDPVEQRMNDVVRDSSLYTSNDMRPKGSPPPGEPEQEAHPETKANDKNA